MSCIVEYTFKPVLWDGMWNPQYCLMKTGRLDLRFNWQVQPVPNTSYIFLLISVVTPKTGLEEMGLEVSSFGALMHLFISLSSYGHIQEEQRR